MRLTRNDLTTAKGEHESIKVEKMLLYRESETEPVVITCKMMRSIGSVEMVQYMWRLSAIEYAPRENEGGNYSATLVSFPRIRSIFGLHTLCYCL